MECVVCAYTTSNGPLISSNCCKNLVCAHPLFTFRYLVCFSMCTYIILHPLFTFTYLVYFVYFGMCTFLCLFLSLFWYVQVLASKNRLNSLQCMFWYVHKIVMINLARTPNWDPPNQPPPPPHHHYNLTLNVLTIAFFNSGYSHFGARTNCEKIFVSIGWRFVFTSFCS